MTRSIHNWTRKLNCRPLVAVCTLVVGLLLSACVTTPTLETPAGFAAVRSADRPTAFSPEGVALRLRSVAHEPEQGLSFWAGTLERHMTNSGYLLYSQSEFDAPAGSGQSFEWIAPIDDDDWIYLTAIVVTDTLILIAEAAGPSGLYNEHRDALLRTLTTISTGSTVSF